MDYWELDYFANKEDKAFRSCKQVVFAKQNKLQKLQMARHFADVQSANNGCTHAKFCTL
jgi:hypothetical protein